MSLYRGMDCAALDAAYNNRAAVKAYPAIAAARIEESARYRAAARFQADLRYGTGARERIDFFPAPTPGAPSCIGCSGTELWMQRPGKSWREPRASSRSSAYWPRPPASG